MEIIVNFWIRTPSAETGAAGREGECTKNCREMEFWVGGQIPECTKRRSNLASHKGKQEFSAFTNTEIHEYGFPKYRNTGEWVWQGGGMVGEYRNKKRLATPSNATTSKYTNASCQKLRNTPLPKMHQKFTENDIKTKTSIAQHWNAIHDRSWKYTLVTCDGIWRMCWLYILIDPRLFPKSTWPIFRRPFLSDIHVCICLFNDTTIGMVWRGICYNEKHFWRKELLILMCHFVIIEESYAGIL